MDSNQQSIGDPCPPVEVNNRGSSALPRGADHTYHVTTPPHRAQTRAWIRSNLASACGAMVRGGPVVTVLHFNECAMRMGFCS